MFEKALLYLYEGGILLAQKKMEFRDGPFIDIGFF